MLNIKVKSGFNFKSGGKPLNTRTQETHLFSDEILHGADYNPEQWLHEPEVLEQDIRYMKEAGCNVMSVGIFSWAALEPEEGKFNFEWMDHVIDSLYSNGISVFLATPSGARPTWLAQKYPEVLRVTKERQRNLYGARHNHCYTSPKYREKINIINTALSKRYSHHPAVKLWHISNEYGGECHCDLCQEAFRTWLQNKYGTLEALNGAWWTTFWSHTYSDWSQIDSPAPHGESATHGLNLDWRRFVTDQSLNFMNHEIAAVKTYNSDIPVTTNFMYYFDGLNYFKYKDSVDIVSWDNYPLWHKKPDIDIAIDTAMNHDMMRSIKRQPFLLMESSPSMTNWQGVSKLKKPGMHVLSSMQAVAHGSNSVQYFQWRKSRGSSEKFHGAVVSHDSSNDHRVFKEVAELGNLLERLSDVDVASSTTITQAAIVYDWENKWAIEDAQGPRNQGMGYIEEVQRHYRALLEQGISVDFVDMECDISDYKLLVAPMLYMLRAGFEDKLRSFVEQGGTLVLTYWSGIVDENDLVFRGAAPHKLNDVVGLVSDEIDGLYDHEANQGIVNVEAAPIVQEGNGKLTGFYFCSTLCDLISLQGAEAIMTYGNDFYAGKPALTRHYFGAGEAYYVASRFEQKFYRDFYFDVAAKLQLKKAVEVPLPYGVYATTRENADTEYLFLQNYNGVACEMPALDEKWTVVANEGGRQPQTTGDPVATSAAKPLDLTTAWVIQSFEIIVATRKILA